MHAISKGIFKIKFTNAYRKCKFFFITNLKCVDKFQFLTQHNTVESHTIGARNVKFVLIYIWTEVENFRLRLSECGIEKLVSDYLLTAALPIDTTGRDHCTLRLHSIEFILVLSLDTKERFCHPFCEFICLYSLSEQVFARFPSNFFISNAIVMASYLQSKQIYKTEWDVLFFVVVHTFE